MSSELVRRTVTRAVLTGCAMLAGSYCLAGEPAPGKAADGDLLSQVLQACPQRNRREFLGSIRFLGNKVVSFRYTAIQNCLGGTAMREFDGRLASVGAKDETPDDGFGELFLACSDKVRNRFFDRLSFQGGRLVGMFVGEIKKCAGKRDMAHFQALFSPDGAADWKDGCSCQDSVVSSNKPDFSCNPKACEKESPPPGTSK